MPSEDLLTGFAHKSNTSEYSNGISPGGTTFMNCLKTRKQTPTEGDEGSHLIFRSNQFLLAKFTEISPRIAKAYATLGEKTLSRDLKALKEIQLIKVEQSTVRANRELILAFLPYKART
jgi:hypothetical protein